MMSLAKKMRITAGTKVVALHAPEHYEETLGPLPENVPIVYKAAKQNAFVQLFVHNKAELDRHVFKVAASLAPGGLLWITYPKGSSGMQTDLTRDKGWECLEQLDMERLTLISFDEQWSAFLMRNTPARPMPAKASADYHHNVKAYSDPVAKTVVIPGDLEEALAQHNTAAAYFYSLAYSHRKEYVLWIVDAKRPETRTKRIQKTIEMLLQGQRNPAGR